MTFNLKCLSCYYKPSADGVFTNALTSREAELQGLQVTLQKIIEAMKFVHSVK